MTRRNLQAVLVTGASKGIGEACALHLDGLGFRVYAGYRAEPDAERLRAHASDRLTPVRLDVTHESDIAAVGERLERDLRTTGLWGLVNNAGVVVPGPLEVIPPGAFRDQFAVNVDGVLRVTQTVLPLLRQAAGRIINVSSVNGRVCTPYSGAYAASKHALEAMSDALRMELRPWNIAVVVIQPGAIDTPIWETSRRRATAIAERLPHEARERYRRVFDRLPDVRAPERALPPQSVAAVVARALIARRPRARYRVGWDARGGVLLHSLLPHWLMDRLLITRRRRSVPRPAEA